MKELSRSILRWLGLSALLLLCPVLICAAADAPPQNRYETVAGLDIVQADMEENRAGSEKTQADAEDVQANTEAAKANTEEATESAAGQSYAGWDKASQIHCRDGRTACCLLQMIMMGEFDHPDLADTLTLRIFSAAADRLQLITSEDISHFCEEFGEDPDLVRECFYQAYSACLLAQIRFENKSPQALDNARLIFLLFLDPSEENAEDQMRQIRENMTPEIENILAESAGMDTGYIKWLLDLAD